MKYNKQIVENAVAYIAQSYWHKTNKHIDQVVLYKILAFSDFECVRTTGRPLTALKYYAERMGPVPHALKNMKSEVYEKRVIREENFGKPVFVYKKEPNIDLFSDYELDVMDKYIDRAVNEEWTAEKASDISHIEIKSWQIAIDNNYPRKLMDYADEFGSDFKTKKESERTSAEANYAIYAVLSN
jgi:hypothetical protein